MNRISLLLIACLLFSFCGPTEAEIQSRIDSAVEEALVETTLPQAPTSTVSQTTTSTTTTLALPTKRSYEDNILKLNQYLLVDQIDSTVYKDSYYIRLKSEWNRIDKIKLIFDNECESWKFPDSKQSLSSVLGINVNSRQNSCLEANKIIAIQIDGTSDNNRTIFTTFYENGYYTGSEYDKNHIENGSVASCCHKIDFIKINLELKILKVGLKVLRS